MTHRDPEVAERRSSSINVYVHIPRLSLEPGTVLQLGEWALRPLPFEEWLKLEDPMMIGVEDRYVSVSPVFLTGHIDDSVGEHFVSRLGQPVMTVARRISYAVLFTLWELLPDPGRSVMYFYQVENGLFARAFGVNERELLLIDDPPYVTIPADKVIAFSKVFMKLTAVGVGEEVPELLRLIETVQQAGRPGHSLLDLVINFVAVHEDIFNRLGDPPLGATFARRLAAFFSDDFNRLRDWRNAFKQLYDVRSAALHGRDPSAELESVSARFTQIEQFLLYECYQTCSQLASSYRRVWQHRCRP